MAPAQVMDRGNERPGPSVEKPSGVLLVERATHQDVSAICTLYKKVWDPAPAGMPPELVKSWLPSPLEFTSWMGEITYFAARRDGRLVGVIGCEFHHSNCHLVHLAVDPETRRQGVATALVAAAADFAKKGAAVSVWVDALHRLAGTSALFERAGFTRVGSLRRHEWGEDVELFERLL